MKLRSGKVLPEPVLKLPENIESTLQIKLHNFKEAFAEKPQHAKEMLEIISWATSWDIRFYIRSKMEEGYDRNDPGKTGPLYSVAGDLASLLINNPKYYHLLAKEVKKFDLEAPDTLEELEIHILGGVEE